MISGAICKFLASTYLVRCLDSERVPGWFSDQRPLGGDDTGGDIDVEASRVRARQTVRDLPVLPYVRVYGRHSQNESSCNII